MEDFIVVKTFVHHHEAELAKGLLTEKGIDSSISADDAGGTYSSLSFGNVKLLVARNDLDNASKVLDVLESQSSQESKSDNGLKKKKLEARTKTHSFGRFVYIGFILLGTFVVFASQNIAGKGLGLLLIIMFLSIYIFEQKKYKESKKEMENLTQLST